MDPFKRALTLLGCFLLGAGLAGAQQAAPRPNVVLITVDTLRADRLGCYGYTSAETPSIDALARDGILFEHAIVQVPLTWPSHAAILTGTYPFHNGVQDFTGQPLGENFRTLAQSLKASGYATGAVVSAFVLDRSWGLARGFDTYYDSFSGTAFAESDLGLVSRRAEASVDEAIKWLQGTKQRPFFLWLHLFDPHSPYDPPEPFGSRFRRQPYDGEIAYADYHLGRLLAWLKANQLYDGTIVVLLSDHGESLGEHGEDEHGFFIYNSTVHVPLIVKPPASSPLRPRAVAPPVESISVAPTILQLAGVQDPIQNQFQADSLVALMTHGQAPADRAAYSETFYPFSSFGWSPLKGMQTAGYHYVEAPQPELYDLDADAAERKNLIGQNTQPAAELKAQLQALIKRYPPPTADQAAPGLSPADAEKLRSLGYVAYKAPTGGVPDLEKLADPKSKLWEFNAILRATDAFKTRNFAAGRALLQRVQASDPEIYLVHFLLAEAASQQGDWKTAVAEFRRTLELNPDFDEALAGLGRSLGMTGEFLEAQKVLRRATTLNPRNFRAWFQLGLVQASQDPAAAARSLEKTLEIQPNFGPALRQLGMMQIEQKRYAEAVANLEAAVGQGMTDAVTYNFLGIAYSRTNRLEQAAESYRRAVALQENYAEAHLNLGFVYERQNKLAEARREYETACRLKRDLCEQVKGRAQ